MSHRVRRPRGLVALLVALTLIAAACGSDDGPGIDAGGDTGGDSSTLSGEVVVSGSSTVEPISARNAEKFAAANPSVAISVDGPGTGDGFEIFCSGESDVSDASRAIKDEEIEKCTANGIEFIELKIAIDGLSVITSTANDQIDCLSFLDLYALLGAESIGFGSWTEANDLAAELASELGEEFGAGHAPYPDAPLVVSAPGEESGTFDSFVEIALEGVAEARDQDPNPRPDYQASPNDNVIVEAISGTPTSLGWVGFAFVAANPDAVKAIAVDGGGGCVEPTPETIASGEFPIARPLFIYVNKAKAEANPSLQAYIDFYMSEAGLASVSEVGYVDLEASVIEATRSAWDGRVTGTRE
ncbi:MAG TPA: phosphate ABC transporter substrate-binding protein PstS family protein [Acidimicrobiales bacterium]